eukprot:1835450-Pleurochrysis_carterae.AAC.1
MSPSRIQSFSERVLTLISVSIPCPALAFPTSRSPPLSARSQNTYFPFSLPSHPLTRSLTHSLVSQVVGDWMRLSSSSGVQGATLSGANNDKFWFNPPRAGTDDKPLEIE